jgi:hypothetical protein
MKLKITIPSLQIYVAWQQVTCWHSSLIGIGIKLWNLLYIRGNLCSVTAMKRLNECVLFEMAWLCQGPQSLGPVGIAKLSFHRRHPFWGTTYHSIGPCINFDTVCRKWSPSPTPNHVNSLHTIPLQRLLWIISYTCLLVQLNIINLPVYLRLPCPFDSAV